MNRIQNILVVALLIALGGCADSNPVAVAPIAEPSFANMAPIEGGLVFDSVLHQSDVEMFPTFADMNSDAKPDLIVGSFRGVSVQLNQSTNSDFDFTAANQTKPPSSEDGIPWG